jgi:hypothetical protein
LKKLKKEKKEERGKRERGERVEREESDERGVADEEENEYDKLFRQLEMRNRGLSPESPSPDDDDNLMIVLNYGDNGKNEVKRV